MNLSKIKSTLLEALTRAGKLLETTIHERNVTAKKTELSIVTATDEKAEKLILEIIGRDFPDHSILAEESAPRGTSPSRWIIDPVDGTSNFAHAYPVACVSIGYEYEGRVEVGGIFDPFRRELFFAERGRGAYMNNKPIHVSKTATLGDALISTGFPYDRRERMDEYLAVFKAFLMKVQDLRRAGSAALDISYVACGRFDGYWECNLQPWDKAAALLILEEAGGRLTNFSGEPLTLTDKQNVVGNPAIHQEMLEVLKPFLNTGK